MILTNLYSSRWVYLLAAIFIVLNAFLLVNEIFWFTLLPVAIFIVGFYFLALDKLLYFVVFATPLALNIRDSDFSLGLSLPTEPILFGVLILFIIKLFEADFLNKKVLSHPISIALLFYLGWMLITCVTSEYPLVSFKFFLARLWFVVAFYYFSVILFLKNPKAIQTFLWLYILALTLIIFYTLYQHSLSSFDQKSANWVCSPFYNDHTIYGAALAMYFPALLGFIYLKGYSLQMRFFTGLLVLIYIVAIILSYTRAAWLSLLVALALYLVLLFKLRLRTVIGLALLFLLSFLIIKNTVVTKIEKNKTESSDDFEKHLKSISNISSDASNLERINRWQSALRMFKERPFFGWGPGTYQFIYAPYQFSYEKTIISTNAGNKGTAHSEYIGPLCESGVLGSLTFISLIVTFLVRAILLYQRVEDYNLRLLTMVLLLGFTTYAVHGMLNNFLDTDKAALPFFSFMGAIVALDLRNNTGKEQ